MIKEKTYLKTIRRLPPIQCPKGVVSEVLKVCDLSVNDRKRSPIHLIRESAYGVGCLMIITIICIMIRWSYKNHPNYQTRIAVNSHLLARQLANGASIIFTEKIK
jgi:hypothetical protein